MVLIKGMTESFIDYPGKISMLIFTGGCNFRCPFCHNPELVIPERLKEGETITEEEVIKFLKENNEWVDALAITGGEPFLHEDLVSFLKRVKEETGLLIKADSNSTFPERLLESLPFVDYYAFDVKADKQNYEKMTRFKGAEKIIDNINEFMQKARKQKPGVIIELRTTIVPSMNDSEGVMKKMLEQVKFELADVFALQQFRNNNVLDESCLKCPSTTREQLVRLARMVKEKHPELKVVVRTQETGEEEIN